jgi:uncharacterized protein
MWPQSRDCDFHQAFMLSHNALPDHGLLRNRDNPQMSSTPSSLASLTDAELQTLERALDALPAPLEPLDLSMLDGYLCGVLVQPHPVPEARWFAHVIDADGRPAPRNLDLDDIRTLARQRHAELNRAIHLRHWFDPWVFELEEEADPLEVVMPWVAGFALAMEYFPDLMDQGGDGVLEPLAALYRAFDPDDLEDADELLEAIEELEPPADLPEAVEALVSSVLLPVSGTGGSRKPARRPGTGVRRPHQDSQRSTTHRSASTPRGGANAPRRPSKGRG